jgi:glutathione S-transferase
MQTTELDPAASEAILNAEHTGLNLVIANKNYSSWSMRPWVAMTAFGIPFTETRILLGQPETATEIARYSAAGRVPVLITSELAIGDSAARAMARSICAEMHSSFTGLRTAMNMNIRARYPGRGRTPEAQGDIGRICEIWETCLAHFGHHHFLFGDFSIADAFFAPVVTRFRTYDVFLAPALQCYADRVLAHPAVAKWVEQAMAETEIIPKYELPPD